MFKRKTYTEVARRYTPPKMRIPPGLDLDIFDYEYKKMVYGFTTVEYRCNETGRSDFQVVVGDQTLTVDA